MIFTPVRRVCGLLAVALLLLAGCKVDAKVDVKVRADGSGTVATRVTLDADAVRRLTETAPIAQAVPLADIRASGWKVSEWASVAGGGTSITLSHEFVGQDDLERRLSDLVGSTGALRDPSITHERGSFVAKDSIAVSADLRHLSSGIRSDADVAKALKSAGVDVSSLDAKLRGELGKALTLTVTVHAPNGESRTASLRSGGTATVSASASHTYTDRVVLLVIGVVLLFLALVLTAVSLVARSRRRRVS